MGGSRGKIKLKEVIGGKPLVQTFPEEDGQGFGAVVDTSQEYCLYMNRDTCINTSGKDSPGGIPIPAGFQFTLMVDVHHQTEGPPPGEQRNCSLVKPLRTGNGNPGTDPEEQAGPDLPKPGEKFFQNLIPRGEGVSAGDEDFPDFRMSLQIGEHGLKLPGADKGRSRTHADPPETETAVPSAGASGQEQHPVPVLMDQPGTYAVMGLPQGILQGKGI
jgi:hypothetical protein